MGGDVSSDHRSGVGEYVARSERLGRSCGGLQYVAVPCGSECPCGTEGGQCECQEGYELWTLRLYEHTTLAASHYGDY